MNPREMYWVTIAFDAPVAGTVQIFAENEDHAKKIVTEAHEKMKEFRIIDCFKLSEEQTKAFQVQEEKKVLN